MKTQGLSLWLLLALSFAGVLFSCSKSSDDDNNIITPPGAIVDKDGNIYHKVTIGNQVWLLENLKTTHYNNGDPIAKPAQGKGFSERDTIGICVKYYNSDSIANIYGCLYNFYAFSDPRGICPAGFHVPTEAEWVALETYLDNDSIGGGKLKEAGTAHWISPNIDATNSTGFTALPGGSYNGWFGFVGLGMWNSLWTSTSVSTWYADGRSLVNSNGRLAGAGLGDAAKSNLMSIRCIQTTVK